MRRWVLTGLLLAVFSLRASDWEARAAFRSAVMTGDAVQVCRQGLRHEDAAIRRFALARLYLASPAEAVAASREAVKDPDAQVRLLALHIIGRHADASGLELLGQIARSDADSAVRAAAEKEAWPFHRENVLLKDDPAWDFDVKTVKKDDLGGSVCYYAEDAERNGHRQSWHAADFQETGWKKARGGRWGTDRQAVVWYRVHFQAEAPARFNSFEVVLPKVAGNCHVWLNGIYLGRKMGSGKELRFNGGAEVLPGRENVLVMRIDAPAKGGLLEPAQAEWLE